MNQYNEKFFNQIINVHYSTDYSSIDRIYPPFFVWEENKKNQIEKYFKKMRKACSEFDLYIHFPYCQEKCAFCWHCSSVPSSPELYDKYLDYLDKEITQYGKFFDKPRIGHVYFGGGTPTLFNLKLVCQSLKKNFSLQPDFQFNVESTFSFLDKEKINKLKNLGVTRLVLGVQSFDQAVLRQVKRTQTREYFDQVFNWARAAGIATINAELMGGLPGQTYESFMSDLQHLLDLDCDSVHIYSYMQTVKTPLGKTGANKVDNELKIKMINDGEALLEKNNYKFFGDDYSRQRADRNLSISRVNRLGVGKLSLGLSAVGYITAQNWQTLSYINSVDLQKYQDYLQKNLFPVEKYYFLDKDETMRSLLISNLRMLDRQELSPELINYLQHRYRQELEKIKEACPILDDSDKLVVRDWLVYSKYLYSRPVLKKCMKIIKRDYSDISDEITI